MLRETLNKKIELFEISVARHPIRVLILTLLLTLVAGWIASHIRIVTSRKAMFPQDTPELVRLNNFLQEFGTGSNLMVVIKDAPLPVLKDFASDFAGLLRKQPEISEATERIDLDFFSKNAFLMVPPALLDQIRQWTVKNKSVLKIPGTITRNQAMDRVGKWLADPPDFSVDNVDMSAAKQGLNRAGFVLDQWLRWVRAAKTPKTIPWERLINRPEAERFLRGNGYFMTHDHKMLIILVNPKNTSEEIKVLNAFTQRVRKVGNDLRAEFARQGKPVPTFGFTGLPAIEHEAYSSIRADILMIVTTAGILVLLLVLFGMRSWRRALVIFIPMSFGAVWNTALTLGTIGHLTQITSGFTAILFGMGVDYGIFMSSRIAEEVEKGLELPVAIGRGAAASARAIVTAGGATTLIFASLYFVKFKGFSEMGMVAATGVFLIIIATFIVLPAIYAILHPPSLIKAVAKDVRRSKSGWTPSWSMSLIIVVLALGLAVLGIWKGAKIPFDYNSLSMLPKGSESAKYQRILVKNSDFQPEVIIFTAPNLKRARKITQEAKKCHSLANVESIVNLFPLDMDLRVGLAQKIGRRVAASGVAPVLQKQADVHLSPADAKRLAGIIDRAVDFVDDIEDQAFSGGKKAIVADLDKTRDKLKKLADLAKNDPARFADRSSALFNLMLHASRKVAVTLAGWQHTRAMTPGGLPPSLRDHFFSKDGHKIAIYAYPRKSVYDMNNLKELIKDVYAIDPQATGFPTTNIVFSKMAMDSLRQGTMWALIIVLFWILLTLRSLRGFVIALVPLLVGESWLLGIMAVFGIDFNYANIITMPLVMALAVDYGVWFVHRRQEFADSSPWIAGVAAAKAILLAAGTTLAGLGAIMMASYRGIASMGMCITIGVAACIIATLIVAPALDQVFWGKK